jgi:hypothetical protein
MSLAIDQIFFLAPSRSDAHAARRVEARNELDLGRTLGLGLLACEAAAAMQAAERERDHREPPRSIGLRRGPLRRWFPKSPRHGGHRADVLGRIPGESLCDLCVSVVRRFLRLRPG